MKLEVYLNPFQTITGRYMTFNSALKLFSVVVEHVRILRRKCGNQGDDFKFVEYDAFQALTVGTRFPNGAIVNVVEDINSRSNR